MSADDFSKFAQSISALIEAQEHLSAALLSPQSEPSELLAFDRAEANRSIVEAIDRQTQVIADGFSRLLVALK